MESWLDSGDEDYDGEEGDSSNDEWMDALDQAEAQFDLGEEEDGMDGMDEKEDTKTTEITDSPTHSNPSATTTSTTTPLAFQHKAFTETPDPHIHWEVMQLLLMPFCKFLEGIHGTELQSRQTCMLSKTHLLMDIIGIQHQQMKSCCSLGW